MLGEEVAGVAAEDGTPVGVSLDLFAGDELAQLRELHAVPMDELVRFDY